MADQQQISQLLAQVEVQDPPRQNLTQVMVQVEVSDTPERDAGSYHYAILCEDGSPIMTEDAVYLVTEQEAAHVTMDGGAVGGGEAVFLRKALRPFAGGGVAGGSAKVVYSYAAPKMKDWLVQRLTAAKKAVPRWVDLAKALQTFWEANFDPALTAMVNLRSIYTADTAGRRRIVAELGGYFEPDLTDFVQPTVVAMRKLELAQKDTAYPILAAIQRMGLSDLEDPVEWCPLYALPADGPYGTKFYHKHTGIPDGAYLTSRGVLMVNIMEVDQGTLDKIEATVRAVKPLHIVYDGVILMGTDYGIPFTLITEDGNPIDTEDLIRITT